jgi:hypothetical protein
MSRKIRVFLALLILIVSAALLVWGYAPNPHEIRIQPIVPAEMRLP